jgi:plasmid stabilization system protein ParE
LRDIVRYISAQLSAPITALKMIEAIEDALSGLSDMPQKHPLVIDDRLSLMGYRKLIVKRHIVFFSINEKEKVVDVERVLYARRDWLHIL